MKLIILNLLLAFSVLAHSQTTSNASEYQKINTALYNTLPWPRIQSLNLSFKELALGGEFQIGEGTAVDVFFDGYTNRFASSGKKYVCLIESNTSIIAECKYNPLPMEEPNSRTAFGEPVVIKIGILLEKAPLDTDLNRNRINGKIMSIVLETINDPAPRSFLTMISNHFNEKFNAPPRLVQNNRQAESIYSAKCEKIVKIINTKPLNSLTTADLESKRECNAEAMIRLFNGAGSYRDNESLQWSIDNLNIITAISYRLSSSKDQAYTSAKITAEMVYKIPKEEAYKDWLSAMAELGKKLNEINNKQLKKDF